MKRTKHLLLLIAVMSLSFSNAMAQEGTELVVNGSFEESDFSSFSQHHSPVIQDVTSNDIVVENGNHCLKIVSQANAENVWDSQLFIKLPEGVTLQPGTAVKFSMRVKASRSTTISTQGHDNPGEYLCWGIFGDIDVSTEWKDVSGTFFIPANDTSNAVTSGNVKTIAFDLNCDLNNSIDFYFDDISIILTSYSGWGSFVAKSDEGIEMTFTIISEAEKTCRVGTEDIYHDVIDYNKPSIDREQKGELTIPASVNGYTVEAIGAFAFCECKIEGVNLPNTIKAIHKYAFAFNDSLKAIDIPENVETIEKGALGWCDGLKQVKLHDGLKTIGEYAFYASGLTSIVLPKTLEYIDYEAFRANPLATITVRSLSPTPIDYYKSFTNDIYQRTTLYVPQGLQNKYRSNNRWGSFRKIKEGEPSFECPSDIAYPVDPDEEDWQYIICNNESSLDINFVNKRDNPVSSISYIPIIEGVEGEEQTYEFPEPIAADGKPFTMPASLPIINEPKSYKFLFEITKINGVEVDYGADIMTNACISGTAYVPVTSHKVFLKNYTSPSCLWAPRSIIGLDKVKEQYGDDVICVSYHVAGPLWCNPYSYVPMTPTCELDGNTGWRENDDDYHHYDPYYGKGSTPLGIFDLIDEKMTLPHLGSIKILSAEWADDEQTEINVVTESTLGVGYEQNSYYPDYLLIFTLVEDGLKGNGSEWEQLNGYSQTATDDPNLQSLTQLPYTITDMVYNDVAVGEYRDFISRNFNYGESVQQTNTLHLSELSQKLIQDKSKLSVVVRLQDRSGSWPWAEGRIQIDCDKLPITTSGDTNGDGAVNAADIVEIVCYIMGKPSDKFITDRADVNRDGVVNAADIVEIVNMIMKNE